jgi:hypothetical protein
MGVPGHCTGPCGLLLHSAALISNCGGHNHQFHGSFTQELPLVITTALWTEKLCGDNTLHLHTLTVLHQFTQMCVCYEHGATWNYSLVVVSHTNKFIINQLHQYLTHKSTPTTSSHPQRPTTFKDTYSIVT